MKLILKVFVALIFFLSFPFFSHVTATSSSSSEGIASVDTPTSAPLSAFQNQELKDYNDNLMFTSQPYVTNSSDAITFISFFEDTLTIRIMGETGTTTTVRVYCGDEGEPISVTGASSYNYDGGTRILTLSVVHSSPQQIEIDWSAGAQAIIVLIRQNYYLVFALIGVVPIVVGATLIIGILKGKETLTAKDMTALVSIIITITLAFIVIINVMNALIGG